MRENEIFCFAKQLECPIENIVPFDLITGCPTHPQIDGVDAVLVGGSGDYSVVTGGTWLPPAMDVFRDLYADGKPTFASCWGFQAFSRALDGVVVTDLDRAEVGTQDFELTAAGKCDPVFGPLGSPFQAQIGHQDIVDQLPRDAVRLCSSAKVQNQAFTIPGKPIYATQFHPELERADLLARLKTYPVYVQRVTGLPMGEFIRSCHETPGASKLLRRFVDVVFGY